jgi:hypothetical protein
MCSHKGIRTLRIAHCIAVGKPLISDHHQTDSHVSSSAALTVVVLSDRLTDVIPAYLLSRLSLTSGVRWTMRQDYWLKRQGFCCHSVSKMMVISQSENNVLVLSLLQG